MTWKRNQGADATYQNLLRILLETNNKTCALTMVNNLWKGELQGWIQGGGGGFWGIESPSRFKL